MSGWRRGSRRDVDDGNGNGNGNGFNSDREVDKGPIVLWSRSDVGNRKRALRNEHSRLRNSEVGKAMHIQGGISNQNFVHVVRSVNPLPVSNSINCEKMMWEWFIERERCDKRMS